MPIATSVRRADTEKVRAFLQRLQSEPRTPTGNDLLKAIDGVLSLIEARDQEAFNKSTGQT